MTDRSFGDHTNKNIVKNPLLSSAVTGLSIEDLTHNAVLLPVSRSQHVIPTQDAQTGQKDTPSNSDRSNFQSGDANFIPVHPMHPPNFNTRDNLNNVTLNPQIPTPRKDPDDDDFDVNEYFARLQGSIYVSAPINLKEDKNSNIETEENLEEINLNETEKTEDDTHNSITADIAQNFAQLPTVLPQVASAVFSSFSNMLYKSREQTPDDKSQVADGAGGSERPRVQEVPLMTVAEPFKEITAPPKEPPICGIGNYRITTKKKAYAPIPGLTSKDQTMPIHKLTGNVPAFTPLSDNNANISQHSFPISANNPINNQATYDLFTPTDVEKVPVPYSGPMNNEPCRETVENLAHMHSEPIFCQPQMPIHSETVQSVELPPSPAMPIVSNTSIIPPPPMFASAPRKDSSSVGKTILPPSVARRLAANQPIMKAQTMPIISNENIFVPTLSEDVNKETETSEHYIDNKVASNQAQFMHNTPPQFSSAAIQTEPQNIATQSFAPHPIVKPHPIIALENQKSAQNLFRPSSPFKEVKVFDPTISEAETFNAIFEPSTNMPHINPGHSTNSQHSTNTTMPPTSVPLNYQFFQPSEFVQCQIFDPTNMSSSMLNSSSEETIQSQKEASHDVVTSGTAQLFAQVTEPPKSVPEPPKVPSGNVNFRMTKKRPQYYSGPIEGIGSISNNVKPTLLPAHNTVFQGAVLTPQQLSDTFTPSEQTSLVDPITSSSLEMPTVPFNINQPVQNPSSQNPVYSTYQDSTYDTPMYTAFDLSRKTTDSFEPVKEDNKGFGLIGSLKSKLSALDINKLQNTVTTFFDPNYNYMKQESVGGNAVDSNFIYPVDHNQYQNTSQHQFDNGLQNVPSIEINTNQQQNTAGDYMYQSQNQDFYGNQSHQYQLQYNYYQNVDDNYMPSSSYTQHVYDKQNLENEHTQNLGVIHAPLPPTDNISILDNERNANFDVSQDQMKTYQNFNIPSKDSILADNICNSTHADGALNVPLPKPADNIFENKVTKIEPKELLDKLTELQLSDATKEFSSKLEQKSSAFNNPLTSFFSQDQEIDENLPQYFESAIEEKYIKNNAFLKSSDSFNRSLVSVASVGSTNKSTERTTHNQPLFLPPTQFFSGNKIEIKDDNPNKSTVDDFSKQYLHSSNLTFFDKSIDLYESQEKLNVTDFNSCKTCKEVDEFKPDGLTAQLIENITAPIQLTNPVEVPLTEGILAEDEGLDFDSNQCAAEIDHIAEETIEAIQIQSATELLDQPDLLVSNTFKYGWRQEDTPFLFSSALPEHSYSLQTELNPIGFICANSLFIDNIPNNASDEIKAEFQNSFDEVSTVLPCQLNLASAPLEEDLDDTQSDDTGVIDVQSIEQDAKKDFPIFEDFNVDPSETDDDKIEFREREKSVEDSNEEPCDDTFTNRVEKFKKMEETTENSENTGQFKLATEANPAMTIASYFDTGNYAADTHYRNTMTFPAQNFNVAPYLPTRIPPGFEEEYLRRLSCASQEFMPDLLKRSGIAFTSDSGSQPQASITLSASYVQNTKVDDILTEGFEDSYTPDTLSQTLCTVTNSYSSASSGIVCASTCDMRQEIKDMCDSNNIPTFSTGSFEVPLIPNEPTNIINDSISSLNHVKSDIIFSSTSVIDQEVKAIDSNNAQSISTETLESSYMAEASKSLYKSEPSSTITKNTCDIKQDKDAGNINIIPQFSSTFSLPTTVEEISQTHTVIHPESSISSNTITIERINQPLPTPADFFGVVSSKSDNIDLHKTKTVTEALPDPINFFSNEKSQENEEAPASFNRLASYFTSPAKTEHSKSFFELSQSQNHYRHKTNPKIDNANNIEPTINLQNIPADKYIANLKLMNDLTSVQNVTVSKEQIVRTINYFSIIYDNDELNSNGSQSRCELNVNEATKDIETLEEELKNVINDIEGANSKIVDIMSIVRTCRSCSKSLHEAVINKNATGVKIKTTMDGNNHQKRSEQSSTSKPESQHTSDSVHLNLDESLTCNASTATGPLLTEENGTASEYTPVKHHWFYRVDAEGKSIWRGFSIVDSDALETAYHSPDLKPDTLVATDGGRFDVNVVGRLRYPVYWWDKPCNVNRCSWFYKGTTDARYVPYSESIAERLEEEYRRGVTTGEWHRRLNLPNNEMVMMHGPSLMVHLLQGSDSDFTPTNESRKRARVMRRCISETEVEDVEPSRIDHLLLLCHGVGSACDMKFRAVEEVVDDFRTTSQHLLQAHYKKSYDSGQVGRVEVLPISWHATLHTGECGVDRRLALLTLDSIPRLRSFTNDTVLDVLFYTSPVYCQTIVETVGQEINRIYNLFKTRNPEFTGRVSLGGHSLGSVIMYDLLCHQTPETGPGESRTAEKKYISGPSYSDQNLIHYPTLNFNPAALYALGSPIAIFECIRGVESLGTKFCLPTCVNFFNIFHPFDPVAYRMEPLIDPELKDVKPFLIPHHKGRKRMHLELKDTMARVGADLKQKVIESFKNTWTNIWRTSSSTQQLDKVVEEELEKVNPEEDKEETKIETVSEQPKVATPSMLGKLNDGRRVDHVLQEAPFEMINEYLFAMSSHVCYWESEDTILLILREIYSALGIQPDSSVPQQSMTVERTTNTKDSSYNMSDYPSTSHDTP